MACKSLPLVVLFALASLLSTSIPNEAASSHDVGVWQPLNPKDPEVVNIGDFAVKEHNEEAKTALKFVSVISAAKRVDTSTSGTYYRLVIAATDRGVANPRRYQALLASEPLEKFLKLISFGSIED